MPVRNEEELYCYIDTKISKCSSNQISHFYKLDEIIDICNKLDISVRLPSGKKKNKAVLYQEIKAYL